MWDDVGNISYLLELAGVFTEAKGADALAIRKKEDEDGLVLISEYPHHYRIMGEQEYDSGMEDEPDYATIYTETQIMWALQIFLSRHK